jgi:hypothetical protein
MDPLKYQIDSLEGVDDAIKPLYAEAESGGFALRVEGVVPKSKFDAVNQKAVDSADESARRRRTVERVVSKLGLEDASGLDDALDALISGKGKGSADQEKVVAALRQEYEAKITDNRKTIEGLRLGNARSDASAAVAKAGFHSQVVDMVTQSAMDRVQIDESGNVRILRADKSGPLAGSGPDGFATFADLASELAAAMPDFLKDAGKGGGGKPPASGGASAKTISRDAFNGMSHADRANFFKSGGKVTD